MPSASPLFFRTFKAILLFLVLSFQGVAQTPSFAWAKQAGGTGEDYGYAIAVDGSGNSYVTGSFNGIVTFGSIVLTSNGEDVFVAKYDASGNVLWAQQAGGADQDYGYGIAVDSSGNSYIIGTFNVSATFGSTTLSSSGNRDVFITKYDTSGNVLWAQNAGGTGNDFGHSIDVDGSGNSLVTGSFQDSATFGDSTISSNGGDDVFIAKYNASGNALWAQNAGGTGQDIGKGITVDGSDNCYITGEFNGTATFGSDTLISSSFTDVFIAKYDDSGNVLWAKQAGGISFDIGNDIVAHVSGNSYITGTFNGTATFGSDTLTSSGSQDVFIAKYDASGNLLWAQQAGGTGQNSGGGITVDGSGNSYVTGYFDGSVTFGSTTLTSTGPFELFIAKYDASGNVLWAKQSVGTITAGGNGIAVDGSDNSYVTGSFNGTATFGSIPLTSNGGSDMFLCKLGSIVTGLPAQVSAVLPTYPNPFSSSFQISLPGSGPAVVVLTDVLGREVHRQLLSESTAIITPSESLPAGMYGLQIRQYRSVKRGKVVKQ